MYMLIGVFLVLLVTTPVSALPVEADSMFKDLKGVMLFECGDNYAGIVNDDNNLSFGLVTKVLNTAADILHTYIFSGFEMDVAENEKGFLEGTILFADIGYNLGVESYNVWGKKVDAWTVTSTWSNVIDNGDIGETAAPVPEPATFALLGFGLLGLAGIRRRKSKG